MYAFPELDILNILNVSTNNFEQMNESAKSFTNYKKKVKRNSKSILRYKNTKC